MEQVFTVPEREYAFITEQVVINMPRKSARIYTTVRDQSSDPLDDSNTQAEITFTELLAAEPSITGAEVTAFKKILKAIIAAGWNKTLADITEEPF